MLNLLDNRMQDLSSAIWINFRNVQWCKICLSALGKCQHLTKEVQPRPIRYIDVVDYWTAPGQTTSVRDLRVTISADLKPGS